MSETEFGAYTVAETIASGGIATIYRAVQTGLGRIVALKTLGAQISPTSSFGAQLDREAKILAEIVHPNIVLLLEASRSTSGRPYIVLEWIDGPSLEDVLGSAETAGRRAHEKLSKKRRLGVPEALAIATGICAALEHIHERGVVHRDVKPSNVLISRSGHVKLIDFGIAQRPRTASMSDALGTEGITASGRIAPEQLKDAFGTPAYMSPEQILGDFVDGRSDLFSLGVVLYEMISGSRPFDAADKAEGKRSAAQRIRREAAPPLRERAPQCPRRVERIVMRLLEKSPNDRYSSAGQVRERLEHALRAETREDPIALVRNAALSVPGHGIKDGSKSAKDDKSVDRARSSPRIEVEPPMGLGRTLLGLGVVALAFAAGVFAIEGTGARAREEARAGSRVLELAPDHAGALRVVATPWAHVRVDGQLVETTPFARPIPLTEGRHFVTLTHPDAPAIERELVIAAGETITLDVTMNLPAEDAGKDGP